MGVYASVLPTVKRDFENKKRYKSRVKSRLDELAKAQEEYVDLLEAQKLLAAVSDENVKTTMDFITGVVNKALTEIWKGVCDPPRVYLAPKLYGGSKPHIVLELENKQGMSMELFQEGAGLSEIISAMYTICLVEIRKGRRFIMLDERFSGLHSRAKRIMSDILRIFAEGGFQFILVEYNLNDIGKMYNVEKTGSTSKVYDISREEYTNDTVKFFSDVDLSILDMDYVEEEYEEE